MKISRVVSIVSALILSGVAQVVGVGVVHAQQPDLSALESTVYYMSLPSDATSSDAMTIQHGYSTWMSIIGNDSTAPVDNASISYMSGYDPSRFDSVTSFPFTSTFTTLEPGESETAKLLPGDDYVPVSFDTGFHSTKTTSPSVIPAGGGQQTVVVTITPVDARYIEAAGVNTSINLFIYSDIPGVTVASVIDPANIDQGEELQTTNTTEQAQWQIIHPQINKTYTFTAVLDVPNSSGSPLAFQPTAHMDGQRHMALNDELAGQSVTVVNPSLDGDVPGSGVVTFSVNQTDRTWRTTHADIFTIVYEGTSLPGPQQPIEVDVLVKPGSAQPAPINPKSHGTIPVAILSTNTFDAATVNAFSVEFGPMGPMSAKSAHMPLEDANGDGRLDMILYFPTQDTGIVCGVDGVGLHGLTVYGQPINGGVPIRIVGCK